MPEWFFHVGLSCPNQKLNKMWKARKIELTKNSETFHSSHLEFRDCYTLEIDGVCISNSIKENLKIGSANYFQTLICTFCGQEGCNAGGFLSIVRHEMSLLFIPCFDGMESWKERIFSDENGDYGDDECPPHEWYVSGILEVDETMLPVFLELLKGFKLEEIPFITKKEMDKLLEWEICVKEKPKDFMRLDL